MLWVSDYTLSLLNECKPSLEIPRIPVDYFNNAPPGIVIYELEKSACNMRRVS